MTLEEALRELVDEYELDYQLTRDSLQELKIRGKIELARDLLAKLAPELPGGAEDK